MTPVTRVAFTVWRALAGWLRPSKRANERRLARRGESLDALTIREASADDIPALAALHVATWNATYAPLGARGPSVALRERQWRDKFGQADPGWFCFVVARPDGTLVGFAQANRTSGGEYAGELNKIYLLRAYQRLGLGRQLVGHVARRFLEQGVTSMWLFGDARNPSSRAWTALGAIKTDDDPGTGNYGWRDIRPLARR
jgi:GNAT superfamily N-acetyltransferase